MNFTFFVISFLTLVLCFGLLVGIVMRGFNCIADKLQNLEDRLAHLESLQGEP